MLRAAKHLEELASVVGEYSEANPYGLMIDTEAEPPWRIGRIEIPDAPLTEWGVIVGDFAHNLRSTLDHLVFQLSILNNNNPEGWNTQFPICESEDDYQAVKFRGRRKGKVSLRDSHLWGLSDPDKVIIDGLQPFKAENARLHPLAILNRMSNRDKHRLITVSHGAMQNRSVTADAVDPDVEVEIIEADISGFIENGAELFRYIVSPDPDAAVNMRFRADHWIGFAGETERGVPPLSTEALAALMMEIGEILLIFERERF